MAPVVVSDTDLQVGAAAPDGGVPAPEPALAASAGLQPVAASDPRRVADPRLAMHGGGPALGGPASLPGVDASATAQPVAAPPDLDALREMLRLLAAQQQQQQAQGGVAP